ncbi:hypothetical protein SUGI_0649860 [Cryptomeria japonica]|nr:hypothetical protein SUGI_0649860 [Cryptomeria japonica]
MGTMVYLVTTRGAFANEAPPPLPQITGLAFSVTCVQHPLIPIHSQITELCTCIQQQCPIGLLGDQKDQKPAHLFDKTCFWGLLAVQARQVSNQQINKTLFQHLEWLEDNPNIVIKRKDCINGSNTFLDIQQAPQVPNQLIIYGWPGSSELQNGQCWHL